MQKRKLKSKLLILTDYNLKIKLNNIVIILIHFPLKK